MVLSRGLVTGFIDHLYTRLGITSDYIAIANLHNSLRFTASIFFNLTLTVIVRM
jgi:hypothetical protein